MGTATIQPQTKKSTTDIWTESGSSRQKKREDMARNAALGITSHLKEVAVQKNIYF